MSISIEASVSIYDSQIAREMRNNAEFSANVLMQLADLDQGEISDLSEYLDEDAVKAIRQLQKAADLYEAAR